MTALGAPLVVLGVGNVLLRDDGVGVEVVRAIERGAARGELALPADTLLVDGGTRGLDLLPLVAGARAIVIVDAMDAGGVPGAAEAVRGAALWALLAGSPGTAGLPIDRGGVGELLTAALLAGVDPGAMALVGVRPAVVDVGLELTPAVRRGVARAVEVTLDEVRRLAADPPASRRVPPDHGEEATTCAA